jgi:RimJ/RimL family protein N-acetyltransferase
MPHLIDDLGPAVSVRPLAHADELDLFNRIPYPLNEELADDLEQGRRRLDWMWVAVRDDRLLGRIAWWTSTDAAAPQQLDIFDVDDSLPDEEFREIGSALLDLARAHVLADVDTPPEYARYLPADWREDPATRRGTELRMELLERQGARFVVERLRLEWTPGTPIAAPDGRLAFRPFESDAEFLDVTTRVLAGTLDAHSVEELAARSPREVAEAWFDDEFARYTTPREWWRVAVDGGGDTVGFVVPARNAYHPIIAYLGVLPEHRGHGYIDGILAEGTRVLHEAGVSHIRASTDVGNVPMAAAFARAGYVTFERLVNMAWS